MKAIYLNQLRERSQKNKRLYILYKIGKRVTSASSDNNEKVTHEDKYKDKDKDKMLKRHIIYDTMSRNAYMKLDENKLPHFGFKQRWKNVQTMQTRLCYFFSLAVLIFWLCLRKLEKNTVLISVLIAECLLLSVKC